MVVVIAAIIFMERGQRRVPIHYAKRVVGMRNYGGQSSHLPLKINMSGVIPPRITSYNVCYTKLLRKASNVLENAKPR